MIEKSIFSSLDLPPELNNKARFNRWVDIIAPIGEADYRISDDVPFIANNAVARVGEIVIGVAAGSILGVTRTKRHVSGNVNPCYYIFVNSGSEQINGVQGGTEFAVRPGGAALLSDFEPIQMHGAANNRWSSVFVPKAALASRFAEPAGRIPNIIEKDAEALALVRQFSRFLIGAELKSPMMVEHAANTLTDLVGLTAGLAIREPEIAGPRGLRAARLFAIEQKIASQFEDHQISVQRVALQLGLSARYIYDLLHETGFGFSDRVMELRLKKSRSMLADPRLAHMRISDVAFICGFSDISYFNRCFRRRFGCTPTAAR